MDETSASSVHKMMLCLICQLPTARLSENQYAVLQVVFNSGLLGISYLLAKQHSCFNGTVLCNRCFRKIAGEWRARSDTNSCEQCSLSCHLKRADWNTACLQFDRLNIWTGSASNSGLHRGIWQATTSGHRGRKTHSCTSDIPPVSCREQF